MIALGLCYVQVGFPTTVRYNGISEGDTPLGRKEIDDHQFNNEDPDPR